MVLVLLNVIKHITWGSCRHRLGWIAQLTHEDKSHCGLKPFVIALFDRFHPCSLDMEFSCKSLSSSYFSLESSPLYRDKFCRVLKFHMSRQTRETLKNISSKIQGKAQNLTRLPAAPRMSLHSAIWNDSSHVLVHSWHENRGSFVTQCVFSQTIISFAQLAFSWSRSQDHL